MMMVVMLMTVVMMMSCVSSTDVFNSLDEGRTGSVQFTFLDVRTSPSVERDVLCFCSNERLFSCSG